ncbi:hypothetical protein CUJ90_30400 [Paraburkholderia terricola]|nr:hypothetical protein CUJ90_30400 [Paraburkholderia terricola]
MRHELPRVASLRPCVLVRDSHHAGCARATVAAPHKASLAARERATREHLRVHAPLDCTIALPRR